MQCRYQIMTLVLIDKFIQTRILFVTCIDDDKWILETKHDKIKIFNFVNKKIFNFFNLVKCTFKFVDFK